MPFEKGAKLARKPDINPEVHGAIPGVPVLATFATRWECSNAGVHAPPVAGIHGPTDSPAYSVVLSTGYEDDHDEGETFTYSGEGGRADWRCPRTKDQEWTGHNKSLRLSQTSGKPVRVVRGHRLPTRHAPAVGYRYDGLYRVTEASRVVGKSGFQTCKFTFERLPGQPPLPNEELRTKKTRKATTKPRKLKMEPVAAKFEGVPIPGPCPAKHKLEEDDGEERPNKFRKL